MVVGQRMRRRRRLLGMTQQDLAAGCGVSFQQIQKYECAHTRVTASMLWKLAAALDVEVGYFFSGLPQADAGDGRGAQISRLHPPRSSAA